MRILLQIAVLVSIALLPPVATGAEGRQDGTTLSGGGLPHAVRLTPADDEAFRQRVNNPPVYVRSRPEASGPAYTVVSSYWERVLQGERPAGGNVEPAADYYPAGGLVRTRQGGEDVWLTLDLRQRAVLDRYIYLGSRGALGPEPDMLTLVRAAAFEEPVGVQVGARGLFPSEARAFWAVLAEASPDPALRFPASLPGGGVWVQFTFVEGRAVRMLYDPTAGALYEPVSGEGYRLAAGALEAALREGGPLQALAVPQQASVGSALWWLLALAGGVALLATAFWLSRRLA